MVPAQWIKRNMLGTYSEKLGRPLTEAEVRVQRSLEQLSVPDWFLKYSRPPKILKNVTPFECRPPTWKTMKTRSVNSPRKTPRKKSPKNTPKKAQSANARAPTINAAFNQTYRITRRPPRKDKSPCISITPSSSGTESDTPNIDEAPNRAPNQEPKLDEAPTKDSKLNETRNLTPKSVRSYHVPLVPSNTFPRISPSRKIENINIVFPKPSPPKPSLELPSPPKTVYTITKNIEMHRNEVVCAATDDANLSGSGNSHASFLIAEVEPCGVTTRVRVFAGLDDSDDEAVNRSSPSPNTRFFNSSKKSTELERMVQSGRRESGSRLIQEIIGELDRSVAEGRGSFGRESLDFARSLVHAPEQGIFSEEEDGRCCSSDSDLAKSTSISYKSSDSEGTTPLPQSEEEDEEDVYWIPSKVVQLPRTSSLLSMLSRGSSRSGRGSGRNSPGLSPIKREKPEDWIRQQRQLGSTYTARSEKASRQLFRIDEATGVIDSGYSDRSGAASSRTATLGRESPSWSLSSSPTLADSESEGPARSIPRPGPQVHSTLSWCEFAAAYDRAFGEILRI